MRSQTEVVVAVQLLPDSGLGVGGEVDNVGQDIWVCQLRGEVGDVLVVDETTEEDVVSTGQDLQTVPGDVGVDLASREEDRLAWLQPVDVEQEGSEAARVSWEEQLVEGGREGVWSGLSPGKLANNVLNSSSAQERSDTSLSSSRLCSGRKSSLVRQVLKTAR